MELHETTKRIRVDTKEAEEGSLSDALSCILLEKGCYLPSYFIAVIINSYSLIYCECDGGEYVRKQERELVRDVVRTPLPSYSASGSSTFQTCCRKASPCSRIPFVAFLTPPSASFTIILDK